MSRKPSSLRVGVPALVAALALAGCGKGSREAGEGEPDTAAVDVAQEAQRVQLGMTRAQVIQILGEPRTKVGEPDGERLTFWTFDAGQRVKARVYVTLDRQGKVVNVETIPL